MSSSKHDCPNCSKGPMKFCPFSWSLFLAAGSVFVLYTRKQWKKTLPLSYDLPSCKVVFVLGGPGAGKGTQCQLLKDRMGWAHLSAGDLLRAERSRGGPTADLINRKIAAGQIVPAEITCGLLQKAMEEAHSVSGCVKFLIDGFPRSEDNVTAWETTSGMGQMHRVAFVLNFECPEEVLTGRLLERGQTSGRNDDQIDVIRKRFQTFQQECKPIVERYAAKNMVRTVHSDQDVEAVYEEVAALFEGL